MKKYKRGRSGTPLKLQASIKTDKEKSHENKLLLKTVERFPSLNHKRALFMDIKICKTKLSYVPKWKKYLKGRVQNLLQKNIVASEKFNPIEYIAGITTNKVLEFNKKFRNLEKNTKINIYTNIFPSLLNKSNAFYTRYFDYVKSVDELIDKNFTKNEIFQIKADPKYFISNKRYKNVSFFQKRSLTHTLNDEEKLGISHLVEEQLKNSLKQSRKKINNYINYYTHIMSNKGFICYAKK